MTMDLPEKIQMLAQAVRDSGGRALLVGGRVTGAQVHDARVAALCRQHGVRELWSADRDFSRFARLAVVNPLVGDG